MRPQRAGCDSRYQPITGRDDGVAHRVATELQITCRTLVSPSLPFRGKQAPDPNRQLWSSGNF